LRLAVTDGYKHAMSSIIDSNFTTLILGIILYAFGSGPVQGFATTLIIGILCSMFSAIFITRLIFEGMLDKGKDIKFWNEFSKNAFQNINLPFIEKRKIYYMVSGLVIAAGIASIATKGFNFGVDFDGGRTYVVQFDKSLTTEEIRTSLAKNFGEAPDVKTFGTDNRYKITTDYLINDDNNAEAETKVTSALFEGVKGFYPAGLTLEKFKSDNIINSQKVGATVADDIKSSAVWAIYICMCVNVYLHLIAI